MALSIGMQASQRRIVYGLNVLFNIVLAVAVAALAVWAAGRFGGRADVSSARLNSLQPRTLSLLRGLNQDVTLTALYSTLLKDVDPYAEKRRTRVADLLALYEGSSRGRVTARTLDPRKDEAQVNELLRRIADKPLHRDESKTHRELLEQFSPLSKQVVQLCEAESEALETLLKTDARLARVPQVTSVRLAFQQLIREASEAARDIEEAQSRALKRYGTATRAMKEFLSVAQTSLQSVQTWMTGDAQAHAGLGPEALEFLRGASARYASVLSALGEILPRLEQLPELKLDTLITTLAGGSTIVVETPEAAEVLSLNDVWPFRTDQNVPAPADGDPRDFAGEQAVSSAILKLTQKEKTAVIFTRCGGQPLLRPDFSNLNLMNLQQLPRAAYQQMNEILQRQNFLTEEWDVAADATPPRPEGAARTIYIVFPPAPPQRTNPMQPMPSMGITPEQRQAIESAVEESGRSVFLVGWQPPPGGPYAFADYLRNTWGVNARTDHLAVQFIPHPQKPGYWWPANSRDLALMTTEVISFTRHEIGSPLASLPGALYMVAPLEKAPAASTATTSAPAGVQVEVVAEVPRTEDVWATSEIMRVIEEDLQRERGTRRRPEDIAPPFPVILAASKDDGDRTVIIGSERFAADEIAQSQGLTISSAGFVAYPLYPANADLLVNALHWLAGEADRISVGARRTDVPRLDRLAKGGQTLFWQIFLVGIWPGLILSVGVGVWMIRQR
jgi:hypothetical protein